MPCMTGDLTRRSAWLPPSLISIAERSPKTFFSSLFVSPLFPSLPSPPRHESFWEHFFVFALDFSVIYVSMPSGMLACLSVSLSDLPTFTCDSCKHPTLSLSGHLTLSRCMQLTRGIINHKRLSSHFWEINGEQVKNVFLSESFKKKMIWVMHKLL